MPITSRQRRRQVTRLLGLRTQWRWRLSAAALLTGLSLSATAQSLRYPLDQLNGNNGLILQGSQRRGGVGFALSDAGDVNGDGLDDLLVSANGADANGQLSAGISYLLFGRSGHWPSRLELANLTSNQGLILPGGHAFDRSGRSLSDAGDVNGDGLADFLIGAPYADPQGRSTAGSSYLVFGQVGLGGTLALDGLDASRGMRLDGCQPDEHLGRSLSGTGDLNGDGLDDFILGAVGPYPAGENVPGMAYILFGQDSFPAALDLCTLHASQGTVVVGKDVGDRAGFSVSDAGDVNGDGLADVLIGAYSVGGNQAELAGEAYLMFGRNNWPDTLHLADLDGSNGFTVPGLDRYDGLGFALSGAGDVNGDGFDDVLLGASGANIGTLGYAGESYLIFGHSGPFPDRLAVDSLDGQNGVRIPGIGNRDYSGRALSDLGDVNGDGLDDWLIGAPLAAPNGNQNAGECYVLYGQGSSFSPTMALDRLTPSQGFILTGMAESDLAGFGLSGAGDLNGDGLADLVIGAYGRDVAGTRDLGEVYVLFGGGILSSIEATSASSPWQVYPNPCDAWLMVEGEGASRISELQLTDLLGRPIAVPQQRLSAQRQRLDLRALPSGTYLLQWSDGVRPHSRRVMRR